MAFEAEIKELQKKVAQNPASLVFAPLADTLRKAGRLDEAIEVCLAGLEHNPSYMTARVILGRTYTEKGQLDEAINEFKKITVADAGNIMAHSMLGQLYMRRSQHAEAIEEYQRVLALNPDDAGTQAALEEALGKAREAPGAAPALPSEKAAPERDPREDKLATITVAEIYIKKGALDEAVEVFQEILQADPGNKIAKAKLAEIVALKEKKVKEEGEAEKKRKTQEGARARHEAEEKRKAEEAEHQRQAEAEQKRKEEEEARARHEAEEKRKAEEAEHQRQAEAEQKRKEEEEARARHEAEEKRKAEEAEHQRQAEAEQKRKEEEEGGEKITAEDIFSVMKMSSPDEVIDEDPNRKAPVAPTVPPLAGGADAALVAQIRAFAKANGILASLLVAKNGNVLDEQIPAGVDGKALGQLTAAIFGNTEKAITRMRYGNLNQLIITGEDGRQILFGQLKPGILVALTDKNVNLGLLRIALHDLLRKAQG
jgi:predicted regulator of Ras-like GTPase activity (Roadblock/LC7/MglB family)/Flp pilus assembly protein TadD